MACFLPGNLQVSCAGEQLNPLGDPVSQVPWGIPGAGGTEVHPMVGRRVQGGPFAPQRGDQSQARWDGVLESRWAGPTSWNRLSLTFCLK